MTTGMRDALDVLGGQVCFLPVAGRKALRTRIQACDWREWEFPMSEAEALQVCVWAALQRRQRFAEAQALQAPRLIPLDVRTMAVDALLDKLMRDAGHPDFYATPRSHEPEAVARFEQQLAAFAKGGAA